MRQFPEITIHLENVRDQMRMAFADYNNNISSMVNAELKRVLSEQHFIDIVAKTAREEIHKAVSKAITSYFTYGDGYHAIEETIGNSLRGQK